MSAPRPRLRVITTQEAVIPERLPGATVVVFDVFLATTTLITILENGARRLFAAGTVQDAEHICRGLENSALIRGGEQDALPVEGYDRGPFPAEYAPETVKGRDVVFVSTNGTRALARAASAERLLVGSIRNAPAVAREIERTEPEQVIIVCAGTKGGFALEDFVGAGVLLSALKADRWRLNDAAWLALDLIDRHGGDVSALLRQSRAASWFREHRREEVLEFAADVGASTLVGEVWHGEVMRAVSAETADVS